MAFIEKCPHCPTRILRTMMTEHLRVDHNNKQPIITTQLKPTLQRSKEQAAQAASNSKQPAPPQSGDPTLLPGGKATPPPSLTVTAQLAKTMQGPRIILQGLQGVELEQQQLVAIQEQLKLQSIARQQGKVPPTKFTLHLFGLIFRKEELPVVNQNQIEAPSAPPPLHPAPAPQMVPQQQALQRRERNKQELDELTMKQEG